jgi:KRAB domain-containing zinc finger protein
VESCNDDKSKVKKKSTKKKVDKNDHIRKKSQGTKVKKESCDKEMQESHDMEMKEESCDTEIKVESGNDDTIFKYDCPVCEKKCKTPNGLTVHISLMHKHFCVHCEKMFSSDEEIKVHLVSHNIITDEEAGEKKYGCEFCDKTYRSIHKLKAHKSTHNIIAMFECNICHKKLKTEGTLSYHKRTVHRDDNEKKFKCEFCGKAFWSRSDMKIHLRMHTNDRPFLCHICSKTFKCSGHLINHNKSIHEDRHWLCHVCGIRFKTKRKYLEHGYTTGHVKEAKPLDVRTWTCEECGKIFARKNDLKIHLRIHSGVKPYQCADCDKAFRCYNHLKQHKVTHTGEKPYECKYCFKRFSQLANVNCHMKKCQYKIRRIVDETETDASKSDVTTRCSVTFENHGQDGEKKAKIQVTVDLKQMS